MEMNELAERIERIERIEDERLRLENRSLELEGKYHRFALEFEKSTNAPLKYSIDALDRIEARIDSGARARSRKRPSRCAAKRWEAA
jgi:hypothetical protein